MLHGHDMCPNYVLLAARTKPSTSSLHAHVVVN